MITAPTTWVPEAFSMPTLGGAYPKLPYIYDSTDTMFVVFDTEADAITPLLPPGLELIAPARGVASFVRAANSPLGGYNEVWVGVRVTWQDEPMTFMFFCVLDNDIAMLAGREIWGIPKKLGVVTIDWHREIYRAQVDRPEGARLCNFTAQLTTPVSNEQQPRAPSGVCLRVIPAPEEGGDPIVDLIKLGSDQYHFTTGTANTVSWNCEGHLELLTGSKQDPWGAIPVLNVSGARYVKGGGRHLGYGKLLHRYSG